MATIREATALDLDAMLDLWRHLEAAQGAHRIFRTIDDPEPVISRHLAEAVADPGTAALVAEDEAGLIGMALAHFEERRGINDVTVVELSRVVVAPRARGTGVGRALVAAAERWAAERGAEYLQVRSFSGNTDAIRFWEEAGFVSRYEARVRPIATPRAAEGIGHEQAAR